MVIYFMEFFGSRTFFLLFYVTEFFQAHDSMLARTFAMVVGIAHKTLIQKSIFCALAMVTKQCWVRTFQNSKFIFSPLKPPSFFHTLSYSSLSGYFMHFPFLNIIPCLFIFSSTTATMCFFFFFYLCMCIDMMTVLFLSDLTIKRKKGGSSSSLVYILKYCVCVMCEGLWSRFQYDQL